LGDSDIRLHAGQELIYIIADASCLIFANISDEALYDVLPARIIQVPILMKITGEELEQSFVVFVHFETVKRS
jgi:hypothetical protein